MLQHKRRDIDYILRLLLATLEATLLKEERDRKRNSIGNREGEGEREKTKVCF